jgi:hypothetical protein
MYGSCVLINSIKSGPRPQPQPHPRNRLCLRPEPRGNRWNDKGACVWSMGRISDYTKYKKTRKYQARTVQGKAGCNNAQIHATNGRLGECGLHYIAPWFHRQSHMGSCGAAHEAVVSSQEFMLQNHSVCLVFHPPRGLRLSLRSMTCVSIP